MKTMLLMVVSCLALLCSYSGSARQSHASHAYHPCVPDYKAVTVPSRQVYRKEYNATSVFSSSSARLPTGYQSPLPRGEMYSWSDGSPGPMPAAESSTSWGLSLKDEIDTRRSYK